MVVTQWFASKYTHPARDPSLARKSVPPLAVTSDVTYRTFTGSRLGCDRDTLKRIDVTSSETSASDTLTVGVPSGARVRNFTLASFVLHALSLYAV